MKILVVEDNPAISRTIEERFACDRATDGWDAIEMLETERYDAIVIDADVPRQSGYGVLTYLREESGDFENVIFVTSAADHNEVQRRFGATLHVIDKGESNEELWRVLGA